MKVTLKKIIAVHIVAVYPLFSVAGAEWGSSWEHFSSPNGEDSVRFIEELNGSPSTDEPATPHHIRPVPVKPPPNLEVERTNAETSQPMTGVTLKGGFESIPLPAVQQLSATHFSLDFKNSGAFMFVFTLSGVKGKTIRVDLQNVSLQKWKTLNPVFAYAASPDDLSIDYATFDKEPELTTIKKSYSGPSIPDTKLQAWHFIDNTWVSAAEPNGNISFVQSFEEDNVVVAMKPVFSNQMASQVILELSKRPNVEVIDFGKSTKGLPLRGLKIEESSASSSVHKPCVLIYAREHADEHDTSWVALGAAEFLTSDLPSARQARGKAVYIIIPILDPDSVDAGVHGRVISSFVPDASTEESTQYSAFFARWIMERGPVDVIINLHNVESAESTNLSCPLMTENPSRRDAGMSLLATVNAMAGKLHFHASSKPQNYGEAGERLGGWLSLICNSVHLPLEVNSQGPKRHLNISDMSLMGETIVKAAEEYLGSSQFTAMSIASEKSVKGAVAAHLSESPLLAPYLLNRQLVDVHQSVNRESP